MRTQTWVQTRSVILGQCLHSLGLILLICEISGVEEGLSDEGLRLLVILQHYGIMGMRKGSESMGIGPGRHPCPP